jgi:hypothetical protein
MPPPRNSDWSDLLEEGERLHAHLIQHFDQMIGENHMDHFDIHYTSQGTSCEYEYISDRYLTHIKEAIRPWILEQYVSGKLFERDQWKPFRDQCDYTSMYYGYRTLFVFHDILYFQLTIRDRLVNLPDGTLGWYIIFEAALYGWKEEGKAGLVPDRQVLTDDRMLEKDWVVK